MYFLKCKFRLPAFYTDSYRRDGTGTLTLKQYAEGKNQQKSVSDYKLVVFGLKQHAFRARAKRVSVRGP